MKTTFLTLTAAFVLTSGMWLHAQQSDEGSAATATTSDGSKTAMMEQCRHMCSIQYNPESPGSLLAWKQELNLTEDQAASLKTVEEKATSDAKALLTAEQLDKLKELSKNMKPQSMMQFMHGMKGKMMSDREGQNAELEKLVAEMNSAPADKKLDAVAALLTKLVEQRKAMHGHMRKMMSAKEKEGMGMCRMMMGMDNGGDNDAKHSQHH